MIDRNNPLLRNLPHNLKFFREKKGFTKSEVGRRTGCCQSWLSSAEKSERVDMNISTMLALCKAFKITPDDLLYREPTPEELNRVPKCKACRQKLPE